MEGDFAGYNIINFLMIFMMGIYIRRKEILTKVKTNQWVLIYLVSALLIFSFSHITSVMFDYSNVLVIIEAVALFKAFESFNIPYNKIINSFGGVAFDIFLIHTNTLFLVYFWGEV